MILQILIIFKHKKVIINLLYNSIYIAKKLATET